jgi:sterol desaturase/sphingolipid hydroxylase (fatty acid hydroxylase superfamily)
MAVMEWMTGMFTHVQLWLFEAVVQPLVFALGAGNLLELAYEGTGWLVVGLLQILVMLAVIGPLQRLWPVEPLADRHAVRVDVLYTLIHRLGLFKLVMFFTFESWLELGLGELRALGLATFHLDQLWPGVTDGALASFIIYLLVFDFVNYWLHRAQHHCNWWWALHSLHHSQRQMTMWTDNRNHIVDDVLRDLIFVVLALLIGVAPGQFVALVALGQLSENFHHANLRLWFGSLGERLWVSPRFHRLHHSIGLGHEKPLSHDMSAASPGVRLGGHNFGVLLPWWDMLFDTANFEQRYDATGVRDQVEPGPDGLVRDYGSGFWAQQIQGLRRLFGRA